MSDSLGVNAIYYFTPCFTLLWLFLIGLTLNLFGGWQPKVSGINVTYIDLLIIGTTLIISSNLLINFNAEIRLGFKALLIALGACGVITYLRENIFENLLNITNWNWNGSGYFESIAVSATVFTLLLAFRVARLVSRTNDEASRLFSVYRKLELLVNLGTISNDVLQYIRKIDESKNSSKLRDAYTKARSYIVKANLQDSANRETLNQVETDLDALVRSKQMGLVLGEMFAIFIFAGITISLALFTIPAKSEGWIRLMVDLFAMLISTVIVFLVVYVFDLDRERDDSKLEQDTETGGHFIKFPGIDERKFDQLLSIFVGIGIVVIYAVLLSHKWLGWFGWIL